MRNAVALIIVALFVISFSACTKCYNCVNYCEVCRQQHPDTTFTIVVCSNTLSQLYYNQYLDTLSELGWQCHDTSGTYSEKFCDSKAQNSTDITNKINAGYGCTPE